MSALILKPEDGQFGKNNFPEEENFISPLQYNCIPLFCVLRNIILSIHVISLVPRPTFWKLVEEVDQQNIYFCNILSYLAFSTFSQVTLPEHERVFIVDWVQSI